MKRILRILLLGLLLFGARAALANPTLCSPGYQDSTCVTPISHGAIPAPSARPMQDGLRFPTQSGWGRNGASRSAIIRLRLLARPVTPKRAHLRGTDRVGVRQDVHRRSPPTLSRR